MKAAVLDSCVLYSAALRDLFMYLTELFQPKWSDQIHDEWMRNVLKNRPDITPVWSRITVSTSRAYLYPILTTDTW